MTTTNRNPTPERTHTSREVASLIGRSVARVHQMIRTGEITAERVEVQESGRGYAYRVAQAEVDRLVLAFAGCKRLEVKGRKRRRKVTTAGK